VYRNIAPYVCGDEPTRFYVYVKLHCFSLRMWG